MFTIPHVLREVQPKIHVSFSFYTRYMKLFRNFIFTGRGLAAKMKVGTRVVRGKDWKWGDQVDMFILLEKRKLHSVNPLHNEACFA